MRALSMSRWSLLGVLSLLALSSSWLANAAPPSECAAVEATVDEYLSRVVSRDIDRIMELVDPDHIVFLGTAPGEIEDTPTEVRGLFTEHYKGWSTARMRRERFISCRIANDVAVVSFDARFEPVLLSGENPSMLVRHLTVWRRHAQGRWLLTESLYSFVREPRS